MIFEKLISIPSCFPGIIPGVKVNITLDYSSDDFRLLSLDSDYPDEKNVVFEIADAHLIVPVGNLQPKVCHSVNNK